MNILFEICLTLKRLIAYLTADGYYISVFMVYLLKVLRKHVFLNFFVNSKYLENPEKCYLDTTCLVTHVGGLNRLSHNKGSLERFKRIIPNFKRILKKYFIRTTRSAIYVAGSKYGLHYCIADV